MYLYFLRKLPLSPRTLALGWNFPNTVPYACIGGVGDSEDTGIIYKGPRARSAYLCAVGTPSEAPPS